MANICNACRVMEVVRLTIGNPMLMRGVYKYSLHVGEACLDCARCPSLFVPFFLQAGRCCKTVHAPGLGQ